MKNLILTALVALNGSLALADSDMLLERSVSPIRSTGQRVTVTLHEGGRISETTCHSPRALCQHRELGRISAAEEREVRDLIGEARKGKKTSGPPELCEAIPSRNVRYSGDEGRLFLSESSSPCGGTIYNDSEAAKELVRRLDQYARR